MADSAAARSERSATVERTVTVESREPAARIAAAGAVATVSLGLVIVAVADSLSLAVQLVPLALSVLVLGLPHGAVDHLVVPRARGEPVTARAVVGVGALYLVVGGLYAAIWFLTPVLAFALFISITLAHWGQGDVYALVAFADADHLEGRVARGLTLVVRGGLPMLAPLVAFPGEYRFVAETLVGLFDPAAAAALEPAFAPVTRLAVGALFGLVIITALGFGYLAADNRGPWVVDALETLGLVAYFAVVPPILAIGLYFCFWHSLRHVLRTMLVDERASDHLARGRPGRAFARFARDAAPLSAAALAIFAVLALAVPTTPATLEDAMGIYLVGIAVLTLPHVVVVTLLDREAGIW